MLKNNDKSNVILNIPEVKDKQDLLSEKKEINNPTMGEEALWKAVITQALMDAGSNSKKKEMRIVKARAISWLSGHSEDFATVCRMADIEPKYVKKKAKEAIKNGCKWRKESKSK